MRFAVTLLHRWLGLATAAFLFVSGLTGAVISWDHELDHLLNAHLMEVESAGPALSPYDLARRIEERDPRVEVTFVPLAAEPGEAMVFGVDPRVDPATGALFEPGYNEVFVDPATGKVQITCPYHERWCAFWISIVALSGLGYVAINFPTGSGLGVQGVAAGLIILCLLMLLGAGVTFHESFSWVRVDDFEAGSVASTGPKIHARERPSSARLGKPQG